jgi:hypothetical protein
MAIFLGLVFLDLLILGAIVVNIHFLLKLYQPHLYGRECRGGMVWHTLLNTDGERPSLGCHHLPLSLFGFSAPTRWCSSPTFCSFTSGFYGFGGLGWSASPSFTPRFLEAWWLGWPRIGWSMPPLLVIACAYMGMVIVLTATCHLGLVVLYGRDGSLHHIRIL